MLEQAQDSSLAVIDDNDPKATFLAMEKPFVEIIATPFQVHSGNPFNANRVTFPLATVFMRVRRTSSGSETDDGGNYGGNVPARNQILKT